MTVPEQFALAHHRTEIAAVVEVRGELDAASAPQLQAVLADLVDEQDELSIVVDLRELTFVDSSGLAVLARAQQRARDSGVRIALAHPSPAARKVLEISGLIARFAILGEKSSPEDSDDVPT